MTQATFTFRLDEELKAAFAKAAEAQDRTAAQYLRVLIREAVQDEKQRQAHDRWFKSEVRQALKEADNHKNKRVAHEKVQADWAAKRSVLAKRAKGKSA